jgi:hypothetical protein
MGKMVVIKNVLMIVGLLALAGCANPYTKNYKSLSDPEYVAAYRTAPAPAEPTLAFGTNPV